MFLPRIRYDSPVGVVRRRPARVLDDLSTRSRSPIVHVPYEEAYGKGFEDMSRRVPDVTKLARLTGYLPRCDLGTIAPDVARSVRGEASVDDRHDAADRAQVLDSLTFRKRLWQFREWRLLI